MEAENGKAILSIGNVLPEMSSSTDGKFLTNNGVDASWGDVSFVAANLNLNNLTQDGYTKLNCYPATCVSGQIDSNTGYPDLLINNQTSVGFKVSENSGSYTPLDVIFPTGEPNRFTALSSYDMTGKDSGTYNLYINKQGEITALKNNNYSSRKQPGGGTTNIYYVTRTRYYDVAWTQPTLSSNGTMGSSNFACTAYHLYSNSYQAYKAFDGNSTTFYASNSISGSGTAKLSFYSSTPIKVTKLTITNRHNTASYSAKKGSVSYSSTGSSYSSITSYNNSTVAAGATWSIDVPTNGYYNYYQISCTESAGSMVEMAEIKITAYYQQSETYQEKVVETTGSSLNANDVWLDTSTKPYNMYKYNGSTFDNVEWVRLPQQVVWSGSAISSIKIVRSYNANGWDEELSAPDLERPTSLSSGVQFTAPYSGWVLNYNLAQSYYLERGFTYTPNSSGYTFYPIKGV